MSIRVFVRRASVLASLVFLTAPLARADVKLPTILGDHMVLQQQMPVPIWGSADPGEHVTVDFAGQKLSADADAQGHWEVKLAALTASNKPADLIVTGKNTVTLHDLLVGEVWICSGQSNMTFQLKQAMNAKAEIAAANHPNIRLFTVPRNIQFQPARELHGQWAACSPKSAEFFSAVGYFFGRDLHQSLNVPVGLIHTSWGGTIAEAWTEKSYLESDADFARIVKWTDTVAEKAKQEREATQSGAATKPARVALKPNLAAVLYNGMVYPLAPVAVRGVIWYQGESNANQAVKYRKLLPLMIQSWRDTWHEPDMKFLIVSLANFQNPPKEPGESNWAALREAQALTAAMPNNGLALAIDLGDADKPNNIHPINKQEVGRRLSLVAEAKVYGKPVVYSGPEYQSSRIDGGKVQINFKFADGLTAKGGTPLRGFQIAGPDQKWVWADAQIDGDSVVVSSPQVSTAAAVRYDWSNNPQGNLYNSAGLPAAPFRTDDWPLPTMDKR